MRNTSGYGAGEEQPSFDAVRELNVITSNAPAEFASPVAATEVTVGALTIQSSGFDIRRVPQTHTNVVPSIGHEFQVRNGFSSVFSWTHIFAPTLLHESGRDISAPETCITHTPWQ